MIERIALFIDTLNISTRAFEMQISASNGLIRKAISNNTDIQSKWLAAIAENYPQLDMNWLLTGCGSMLREEKHLITESPLTPISSDTMNLRLMDKLDEKDAKIDHLNEELSKAKEELTTIRVQFTEYRTYCEEIIRQLKASIPEGKDVSTKKPSSQNADNATSGIIP